jgi:hypothetical protein
LPPSTIRKSNRLIVNDFDIDKVAPISKYYGKKNPMDAHQVQKGGDRIKIVKMFGNFARLVAD